MKKSIIITSSIILCTVILAESGVFSALAMFVLMGQIPGTSYSVPASTMLALVSITTALIFVRFIAIKTRHSVAIRRLIKTHLAHKARMPRRRFGQI
jgi:hypothetical protein